jgi:betaine-aldehyde dehydrogenase
MKVKGNYINGQWVAASSGKEKHVINPANGQTIASIYESTAEDVRQAVAAAKRSFYETREWRNMCPQERADMMFRISEEIAERKQEIAALDSINNGKPLREAECDVEDAVQCFRYYAGLITKPNGSVYNVNKGFGEMHTYTVNEPIGVCAQITPWNYPFLMAAWKLAPALAAGNSIVFKPSSVTPLSSVILFEIFDKMELPAGTVNLVLGSGSVAGQELAENMDIDMISFTGSTAVGQTIAQAATGNLKRTGLELGGKSPNIIFSDADFEGAVEWAMIGIFFNQGEVCSSGSRIIIEKSLKDKFVKRLAERSNALTIGDPLSNPDMGPLVSEEHMNTVLKYIELGKKEGAICICGGERYTEGECGKGYFVRPTIFDNCTQDMRIVKEEIFGPVVTIQTFETEEEAIALANDTPYGLAGAVFTADGSRALRVIKEIRAGITWINCYNPTFNEAPWGGYKMSGIGRELGVHGFEEYQEIKQININLTPGRLGWYEENRK